MVTNLRFSTQLLTLNYLLFLITRAPPLDPPLRLPGKWKSVVSFAAIIWMSPGAHNWFTSVTQCIPRKPLRGFCVTYQGMAVRGSEDIFVPAHL